MVVEESSPAARGPLAGVKVLDLSRWISGPFCAKLLADFGADVIKIERPSGEEVRDVWLGPDGVSLYWAQYNANKRAMTLDTRASEARLILRSLVKWADVLVENYRPGTLARMGLSDEELKVLNPQLIKTSISGFGQFGPNVDRPLFNAIAEATTGAMYLTRSSSGEPQMSGTFMADHAAGLYAAIGALLALFSRERTGSARSVDLALFDATFALLGPSLGMVLNGLPSEPGLGNRDVVTAPSNVFLTSDGRAVYLDVGTDAMFAALCEAMEDPQLGQDPLFLDNGQRMINVEKIETIVSAWTTSRTLAEVDQSLKAAGVPFGLVTSLDEAARSDQVQARKLLVQVAGPKGPLTMPGVVPILSPAPESAPGFVAAVGEHTEEVLIEICRFTTEEISQLRTKGVI